MKLVEPTTTVHHSFLDALKEFQAEGRHLDLDPESLEDGERFAAYLVALHRERDDAARGDEVVSSTTLWLVDGEEYLGRASVRHELTDRLRLEGGHIGYEIRPTRRGQGLGTAILRLVLPVAHRLGIDPALVTCAADNTSSRRVIEACGGVQGEPVGDRLRYWVPTGPTP